MHIPFYNKGLHVILILTMMFSGFTGLVFPTADAYETTEIGEWLIDGNTVYVNDSRVFASATPHTVTNTQEDVVFVQAVNMPEYDWKTWEYAFRGMFSTSPLLREYWVDRQDSYPETLRRKFSEFSTTKLEQVE